MSQQGQNALRGMSSFPLTKYSWTTDAEWATKFTWKHSFDTNLLVVFDNFGASSKNPQIAILKVLHGPTVSEHVDIFEMLRQNDVAVTNARQQGFELVQARYPISLMYRRSAHVNALQYQLPDKMVRRIQLKFTSLHDYDAAHAIFESLGVPMFNSEPTRPATATISSTPSGTTQPPQSSQYFPTPLPTGPEHQSSSDLQPISSDDRPQSSSSEHVSRSFSTPYGTSFHTAQSRFRESTSLLPIDEMQHVAPNPMHANVGSIGPRSRDWMHVPVQPTSVTPHTAQAAWSDPALLNSAAFDPTQFPRDSIHHFPPVGLPNDQRPTTAARPELSQLEFDMSSLIPPRRELPFKRPSSSSSSVSRPSSVAGLALLPQPSFASPPAPAVAPRPSSKKTNARTKSTAKKQDDISKPLAVVKRPGSKAAATRPSTAVPKASAKLPARPSTAAPRPSSSMRSSSPALSVSDMPPPDFNRPSSSSTIQPKSMQNQPHDSSNRTNELRDSLHRLDTAFTPPMAHNSPVRDGDRLANYAALPYEERMSFLEDMLIEALNDENFITLCQDMYGCWQRIGLEPHLST